MEATSTTPLLSLNDIAELTFAKSPAGALGIDAWKRYLYDHREFVHVIAKGGRLLGMIIAKNQEGDLKVVEMITLQPGVFEEFIHRAFEIFGEFKSLTYHRRGKLKTISYQRLKELTHYE